MANDGRCPQCGQIVSGEPGTNTPIHRPPGEQKACPGGTIQPR